MKIDIKNINGKLQAILTLPFGKYILLKTDVKE